MYKKNRILITGASGFIGKHLLNRFLENSDNIACFDLTFSEQFIQIYGKNVTLFQGNLLDKDFVSSCIKEYAPNFIFHLAGSKNRSNALQEFETSFDVNYLGTLNLFKACLNGELIKLITVMGTIEEYGRSFTPFKEESCEMPTSAYGLSKLSVSKLSQIFTHQFNLPVLVLRPSIAYGPGQGEDMFIPSLIKSLLKLEPFSMTEGLQLRDFIYIDDLIESMLKGMNMEGVAGNIINIASGISVPLKDVAIKISNIIGNAELLKIGDIPYRRTEVMDYEVNIEKAKETLDWKPGTSLERGLAETINYYKKQILDEA